MKKIALNGKYGIGKFVLVDDEDYQKLAEHRWSVSDSGYVVNWTYNKQLKKNIIIRMHRVVMGIKDPKLQVDHINHDKLDNQKKNLRLCSNAQNTAGKMSTTGSSRYKGVSRIKHNKRKVWRACITKDYTSISLGYYEREVDAARAYNKKALELFGEFAYLNKI